MFGGSHIPSARVVLALALLVTFGGVPGRTGDAPTLPITALIGLGTA